MPAQLKLISTPEPKVLNLYFNLNAHEHEIPCKAQVEIDGENAKVLEIEAWTPSGETPAWLLEAIEERAIELAYEHMVNEDLRRFPTKAEVERAQH
jgi:hypothetical protein